MHSIIQRVKQLFTYYLVSPDCGCQKLWKLRLYIMPSMSHCFAAQICQRFFTAAPRGSPSLCSRADSVLSAINRHLSQKFHILYREVLCSIYSTFSLCCFQKKGNGYVNRAKAYKTLSLLILHALPAQMMSGILFLGQEFLFI